MRNKKMHFSEPLPVDTNVFVSDVNLFGDLKQRTGKITAFNVDLVREKLTGQSAVQYLVDFGTHSYWLGENQLEGYLLLV